MTVRAVAAVGLALATATPAAAPARRHRLRLPPAPLAHALTVDAFEWGLRPSKRVVAAGAVRLHLYNRGQDDHDLEVLERPDHPVVAFARPSEDTLLTVRLAPGTYRLVCSLARGTPESHEARGMWFELEVR